MHVVVAPDKFKGSLTAVAVAARVSSGLRSVIADLPIVQLPVADGGDGSVDAAVAAGFERVQVEAEGPTGESVLTSFARRDEDALVEMATVCGLQRLPGGRLEPLASSSFGLGTVLLAAVEAGCRRVVLGIGGSASTDGGAGLIQALGGRILDSESRPVPLGGRRLGAAASLDLTGLHPALAAVDIVVACDVDNPLYGPNGAAAVYGPQKGASPAEVELLDAALRRWADVVTRATGVDHSDTPGAGAAGGVGFAAVAVLGATLRPGIEIMLDMVGFRQQLQDCRLVITGEGSLDKQTLAGKAPAGVAAAARQAGVRTVAVTGHSSLTPDVLRHAGICGAYPLTDIEPSIERCIAEAGPLLERVAATIAREWLSSARVPAGTETDGERP